MKRILLNSRLWTLIASFGLLALVLMVTGVLIKNRPVPKQKAEGLFLKPKLTVQKVRIGEQPIQVIVYGTVTPENAVTLVAPYAGTVQATQTLYPGKPIEAGELLFSLEKVKLELEIGQLVTQLQELDLKEAQAKDNESLLKSRIQNTTELIAIAEKNLKIQEQQLVIERRLFSNIEELHTNESVSTTEFLLQQAKLLKAESSLFDSKTQLANRRNELFRLEGELNNTEFTLRNIKNQRKSLELKIGELHNDLSKAEIKVNFPAQVTEVFVEKQEEVALGSRLATVRSVDEIEISVNIPDSYFQWLYAGDLLEKVASGQNGKELDIVLVNRAFRKRFSGGYIKSVADSVNIPTRSLPLLIGRKNPRDEAGELIPDEELKPGMYCEVTLHLFQLKDVFQVPRSALQSENHLYHAIPVAEGSDNATLGIIQDVEILHENPDGVIVRIPSEYQELWLITSPTKRAWKGMEVSIAERVE